MLSEIQEYIYDNVAWRDNKNKISRCLDSMNEKEMDLNYSSRYCNESPLILHAVKNKDNFIIKKLIERGANINRKSKCGKTALMEAVYMGFTDIVELLLKYKCDVNAIDNMGTTALMYAVQNNNFGMAEILLDNKFNCAKINIRTCERKKSALTISIDNNNIDMAKYILSYNSFFNTAIIDEYILDYTFMKKNNDMIKLLIDKYTYRYTKVFKQNNFRLFTLAMRHNNIEIVKYLIDKNVNINITNKKNKTVLYEAVKYENIEIINILLKSNIDVDIKDYKGRNILLYILDKNKLIGSNMVKKIIKKKDEKYLNIKTNDKETAIMIAVRNKNYEVVKLLLKYGGYINKYNRITKNIDNYCGSDNDKIIPILIEKEMEESMSFKNMEKKINKLQEENNMLIKQVNSIINIMKSMNINIIDQD